MVSPNMQHAACTQQFHDMKAVIPNSFQATPTAKG